MKRMLCKRFILISVVIVILCGTVTASILNSFNIPFQSVIEQIGPLVPIILVGLLGLFIFISRIINKTANDIIKPFQSIEMSIGNVGKIEESNKIELTAYEELNPIIYRLNSMSENLDSTLGMLSYEKHKYSFILENVSEGLVLIGMDLKILHINRAAKQYFNVGDNAIGQEFRYLSRDDKIIESILSSKEKLQSVLFDSEEIHEGTVLSVKVLPAHFKSESELETKGILIVLSDVTHARKTSQLRSEFVANASHELKTPLTSVKGFAEIIASGIITDNETINDYLKRIQVETDRMIVLINDILNIYQLEEGKKASEIRRINLKDIATEVMEGLLPQANSKNIKLEISEEDIYYNMERDDIKHILQNLIDNGIKYNKENGKVNIILLENNRSVKIIVMDTGIGIPTAYQTRVFERFYRVDKGRSRKVGGTGLGLSIVKHTVAKYKGQITLNSREGKGCRIEITFPK